MAEDNNIKLQVLLENHRTMTCRHFDQPEDIDTCRRGNKVRDTNCGGEIEHCDEEKTI